MKNPEDAEEECPTCEKKFPNMAMLSDHFDEDHGSSDEDEKPEEISSKGITISNANSNNNNNNSIHAQCDAIQNSERAKQLPKNTTVVVPQSLVKPRFVEDARVRRVKDVSGATIPSQSGPGDPFMQNFLSFVETKSLFCSKCSLKFNEEEALTKHLESHGAPGDKAESAGVSAITYTRNPKRRTRSTLEVPKEEPEIIDLVDEDPADPNDPLNQHILAKGLPLLRRGDTVSDGNCWYDSMADQVRLHNIDGVGRNHQQLREEVCHALPNLAQAPMWKKNVFGDNNVRFRKFIARHRRPGEWTDVYGIMCQATALYLGRNIMVVGTINSGPGDRGYTTLEGGPGADAHPPLYVGYYQDQHYQSLQRTDTPASLDLCSGSADLRMVTALGKEMGLVHLDPTVVSDMAAWRISHGEKEREQKMNQIEERFKTVEIVKQLLYDVMEEVARVGIVKEVPEKRRVMAVSPPRPLSKEEEEKLEESQRRLDKMIDQLNLTIPDKSNQERLEIFQMLSKAETIVDFQLSASPGLVMTPMKHKEKESERERPRKVLAPLQLGMGRQVTPTKYKGSKNIEEESVSAVKSKEEKSVGGNIYTCIKCGQAFEKINLFVKHFIQNHKDVINANRNSKDFSFSNYWTKSKKGVGKTDEEKKDSEVGKKKSKKSGREVSLVGHGGEEWDLQMDCHPAPLIRPVSKKPVVKTTSNASSLYGQEYFSQPVEASSVVYDVELEEVVVGEQAEEVQVQPIDSFQCIPLSEIKVENPFEELPFNWEEVGEDLLEEKNPQAEQMIGVVELQAEEEGEEILGLASHSELAVGAILEQILDEIVLQKEIEVEDDLEELFTEEVVDTSLEMVRHQVYIKDFAWVPLEDQFKDCEVEEKTQAEALLLLRKLDNCIEEQREEVKNLMLRSSDENMTTSLVLRILGENALPLKAYHGQEILATPKLVAVDHCYTMRKKAKSVPAAIIRALTRVKSKVEVVPALPRGTESSKSAFSGVRPPPIQVSNNNVIRVKQGTNDRKPLNTNSANRGRRIDLLVGGKVRSTLAEWREEVIENNNTEEKKDKEGQEEKKEKGGQEENEKDGQEEKKGRDDQEEKENLEEVYPKTIEELKEEKRREQYRRIQEFKRKKSEEKSTMKKRRLEEGRLERTIGEVNMTQELSNPGELRKVEIGDERKSRIKRDETGQSSSSMNKNEAPSPTVKKEDIAKAKTGREGGIQIRTDLLKSKEVRDFDPGKKHDDIPSSLSLAATLAGLEDLFAEDSSHVNPQENLVSKVFQNSIKNQHSQSRPATPLLAPNIPTLAPTTPQNILVSDPGGTDLLQAAMRETFSSDLQNLQIGASDFNIKQEKAVNINNETSPCKNANDYSIKQEMIDEVSLQEDPQNHGANSLDYNIKKEPLDSSTAAKELAGFFSDFGVAVVKSEPEVVEEVPFNLGIEDNEGEVLFLSSSSYQDREDDVIKCSLCPLTFQEEEALTKHTIQLHTTAALKMASLKSRVRASKLPTLSLTRVPLPPSFKRKMQEALLDQEPVPKVVKTETDFSSSSESPARREHQEVWSESKNLKRGPAESVNPKVNTDSSQSQVKATGAGTSSSLKLGGGGDNISKMTTLQGEEQSKLGGGDISKMTTLQALDSLLGSKPATDVACPVCGRQGFPTLPALRRHLAYHPHNQCEGKVHICYICDEKYPLMDPDYAPHISSHLKDLRTASPSQCPACFLNLPNNQLLETHVRSVHQTKHSFPCPSPQCAEVFERRRPLQVHLRSRHPGC